MQHGGDRKSEDFNTEISVLISQPKAAAMLNVSTDSVQSARKVLDQGSEELISKVAVFCPPGSNKIIDSSIGSRLFSCSSAEHTSQSGMPRAR